MGTRALSLDPMEKGQKGEGLPLQGARIQELLVTPVTSWQGRV